MFLVAFCFSTISVISITINSFNKSVSDVSPFKHASNNSMPLYSEQSEDELMSPDMDLAHTVLINETFIFNSHLIKIFHTNGILLKHNCIKYLPIFIQTRTLRI